MTTGTKRTSRPPEEDSETSGSTYVLDDQIGFLLRRAHQRASVIFQSILGKYDLTPLQLAALSKLRDEGRVSQNQLGRLTAMDPVTIMGVIQRLAKRKLIRRIDDPNDKRRTVLMLSAEGLKLFEQVERSAFKVSAETLSPLSATEQRVFLDLLQRLT